MDDRIQLTFQRPFVNFVIEIVRQLLIAIQHFFATSNKMIRNLLQRLHIPTNCRQLKDRLLYAWTKFTPWFTVHADHTGQIAKEIVSHDSFVLHQTRHRWTKRCGAFVTVALRKRQREKKIQNRFECECANESNAVVIRTGRCSRSRTGST